MECGVLGVSIGGYREYRAVGQVVWASGGWFAGSCKSCGKRCEATHAEREAGSLKLQLYGAV